MKDAGTVFRRVIVPLLFVGAFIPFLATTIGRSERSRDWAAEREGTRHADFDTIKTDLRDYIWPTDASTRITSSFAEYRSTHFHGGIDISTNGRSGYSVFAVRDGYVYRVRMTPNGYGKMLFIKHHDGYFSTYAHLSGFNDAITRVVREEQYRTGHYSVDLTFDSPRLAVRQGELVAFTGDTGFGPPHLHFELRDENLNPVNPLLCANYAVDDGIPPTIRRIMITPLNALSTVEDNAKPRTLSRFGGKRGHFVIRDPIRVHGEIGFGVEALDRSDGSASKAGVHSMEFYLDDSLTYRMQLDRVPAEETKQILLHYDFPMILDGAGKFQKLYVDAGNVLPFYGKFREGAGIVNTEAVREGEHAYRIVVKDIRGNTSELRGTLLANHRPSISIKELNAKEIVLAGTNLSDIEKYYVFGKKNYIAAWSQHTLARGRYEVVDTLIHLPVEMKNYDIVKVVAETHWGSHSAPQFYYNRKPVGPLHKVFLDHEVVGPAVKLTVSSAGIFTEPPRVRIREGGMEKPIPMEAVDVSKYMGIYMPSDDITGPREATVEADVNGRPVTQTDQFQLFTIPPYRSGLIATGIDGLVLSFDSGAVYRPMNVRVSTETSRGSIVYELEPQDELVNRGIRTTLPIPAEVQGARLALYFRGNEGWIFQTSVPDPGGSSFSTSLERTLGELAIFNDETSPSLGRLRVAARGGKVSFTCRYYDNLSGVDTDSLKITLNGALLIPEVDGEHHRLSYQSTERLDRGRYTLAFRLKDRAGNEAEYHRMITVR